MKFNVNVKSIEISEIRKINTLASKQRNCIKLTLGEPMFDIPKAIKTKAIEAINSNFSHYTATKGNYHVLNTISKYSKEYFNLDYSTDEIITTVGVTEGLSSVLTTILNTNDEVIIPSPFYPGYPPLVKLNNAKCIYVDTTKDNYQLTVKNLKQYITNKTKCIILNYPNNPTGVCLSKENIQDLHSFFRNKNIYIILDEVYNRLVYNDILSLANFTDIRDRLIILNGFSKSHAMTGYRLGYILSNKDIINEITKVHQYRVSSASSIVQYSILNINDIDIKYMQNHYIKNLDYLHKFFYSINMDNKYVYPNGAFYIFLDISEFKLNSTKFAHDLLDRYNVAVVPGIGFGKCHDNNIRISFAGDFEDLKTGLKRFESYIKYLRKDNA